MRLRSVLAAATLLAAAATALPAAAHVTVKPGSVAGASPSATLTFHVPNERKVPTTGVTLVLPTEAAFAQVEPQLLDGWNVGRTAEGVAWTGGAIPVGGAQDFAITLGPFPAVEGPLVFKVLQTYEDGTVARWIEPPLPGGGEPEHPAAVLRLTAPFASTTTSPATTSATTRATTPATTTPATTVAPLPTEPPTVLATTVAVTEATATTEPADGGGGGSNVGAIVGGAIVVVLLGTGVAMERRRRRPR